MAGTPHVVQAVGVSHHSVPPVIEEWSCVRAGAVDLGGAWRGTHVTSRLALILTAIVDRNSPA